MKVLAVIFIVFGAVLAQNDPRKLRLNSGQDIPSVGLGTGGFDGAPQGEIVKQMVRDAVGVGYRLFDTAAYYTNEQAIGEALNELIAEGKVKREELFISTKVFFLMGSTTPVSRADTVQNILAGLQKLNSTYLDLVLFHAPSDAPEVNSEVWKGFEDALNVGWVKSIGVSNFNLEQLRELIETANVFPAVNQVESHPKLPQTELLDYCSEYKIRLSAWSPLGGGSLVTDPVITEIGKKYNKSAAQVMLRYQYERGVVVVPKSTKVNRMIENIDIFDFKLTDEDFKTLDEM